MGPPDFPASASNQSGEVSSSSSSTTGQTLVRVPGKRNINRLNATPYQGLPLPQYHSKRPLHPPNMEYIVIYASGYQVERNTRAHPSGRYVQDTYAAWAIFCPQIPSVSAADIVALPCLDIPVAEQAELWALQRALKAATNRLRTYRVDIRSKSSYWCNVFNNDWLHRWILRNGAEQVVKDLVPHRGIVTEIYDTLTRKHTFSVDWILGSDAFILQAQR